MQRASVFTGWHVKVEQINSEVSATKKRYLNDFLHSICSLLCNSTILFENKQLARILQQTADENRCRLAKLFSFYRKYFYDFLSILNFDFLFDSVGELRKKKSFLRHENKINDFLLPSATHSIKTIADWRDDEESDDERKERQTPASKPSKVELRNNKNINSRNVFLVYAPRRLILSI